MNREITMDRKVPLRESETSQKIPRCVALTQGKSSRWVYRWIREGRTIESLATRILRPVHVQRLTWNQVRANIRADPLLDKTEVDIGEVDGGRRMSEN